MDDLIPMTLRMNLDNAARSARTTGDEAMKADNVRAAAFINALRQGD